MKGRCRPLAGTLAGRRARDLEPPSRAKPSSTTSPVLQAQLSPGRARGSKAAGHAMVSAPFRYSGPISSATRAARPVDPDALLAVRIDVRSVSLASRAKEGRGSSPATTPVRLPEGLFLARLGLKVAAVCVPDPVARRRRHREERARCSACAAFRSTHVAVRLPPSCKALEKHRASRSGRSGTSPAPAASDVPFFGKTASFPHQAVPPQRAPGFGSAPIFPIFNLHRRGRRTDTARSSRRRSACRTRAEEEGATRHVVTAALACRSSSDGAR